jgi:glycosyltransferase involved in cell wall biosynthesis
VLFPQFFHKDSARRFLERKLNHPPPGQWFFANSQSTKNDICNLAQGLDPKRVVVTPLAASEHFRPCGDKARMEAVRLKYHLPPEPFFLSVCTLEPRKNLVHVIQAFGRLIEQEKISGLNLVLVGAKGWQYDQIFTESGATNVLKRRVIFTGYVPDEDLAPLYTEALAFLYLSLYEGFGLPVLEAMQCGIPVVTSDNSSLPEVAGDAGILLDARDQDALCAAVLSLYGNAELRAELRRKSLRQAARFSWQQCAQATLRGYDQALRQT